MSKTWRERIVEARERGEFTVEDNEMAFSWATCAVGEQHEAMPHVVVYLPRYNEQHPTGWPDSLSPLFHPGVSFMSAVENNAFGRADSLLDIIEDRVLTLKREHQP